MKKMERLLAGENALQDPVTFHGCGKASNSQMSLDKGYIRDIVRNCGRIYEKRRFNDKIEEMINSFVPTIAILWLRIEIKYCCDLYFHICEYLYTYINFQDWEVIR